MKTALITSILLFCLTSITLAQTVRRVNNRTDLHVGPVTGSSVNVYSTFAAAHTAAVAGDIIYLEGSPTNYGALSITKNVHVKGPGYAVNINGTQQYTNSASVTSVTFSSTSDGASIEGVIATSTITVANGAIGITISKLRAASTTANVIAISGQNVTLEQCLLYNSSTLTSNYPVSIASTASDVIIKNNIIIKQTSTANAIYNASLNAIAVYNNTIVGNVLHMRAASFDNNIFYDGDILGSYTGAYNNNITGKASPTSTKFTTTGVVMTNVFVSPSTSTTLEASWEFVAASGTPAHDVGTVGNHIGHNGGTNPYVLSGMPSIPAIYQATVPSIGSGSTISITFKSKSH